MRVGKIPAQIILIVLVATTTKTCRYTALGMEGVHGFKPLAEAARRHRDLDDMRELPLNGFAAGAAFIATYSTIFYHGGAARDRVLLEFA